MKKNILFISVAWVSLGAMADTPPDMYWGDVPVMYDSYGHQITRDGGFSTGEAVSIQSGWGRNNITGEIYLYEAARCGIGNCVSKDYRVVGNDDIAVHGAFLIPNEDPDVIQSLTKYAESYIYGINWEGTRLVGIVSNPRFSGFDEVDPERMNMMYLPIYCDIDPSTGIPGDPVFLPCPTKDFFGVSPQFCSAAWISDDGKTILGQVIDNSGFYMYPVVYREDANGDWDYILPSESLFNPDNLPVPQWPPFEMKAPQAEEYIGNPEKKELFEKLLYEWINQSSSVDPYELLNPAEAGDDALMTEAEWNAYQIALEDYAIYSEQYQYLLDGYYEEMSQFLAHSTLFLENDMTMNHDGTLFSQTKIATYLVDGTLVRYMTPYLFDLTDNSYKALGDNNTRLQITQILPDGTLIAVSPNPNRDSTAPDATPQHTYVYPVGGEKFVEIQDYIAPQNPEVYEWMTEYLKHDVVIGYQQNGDYASKTMYVTGLAAVSDDFTSLSAGVDAWSWDWDTGDYVTYFISGMTTPDPAGVKEITVSPLNDGKITVFNLQGVKVMESRDSSSLTSLPKGIYIINGKKVVLR